MRTIRISIAAIVMFLISIGIVMIYSSSGVYALKELGDASYFLNRHLLFLFIGFVLTFAVMTLDYRVLQHVAKPMVLFTIVLLILVLIPEIGKSVYGARRWFKIGPFNFQPSELAKLAMIIYGADYLARKQNRLGNFWYGFLPIILVLGAACLLILKQPDLGNAVLVAMIVLIMMFIAGAKFKHLACIGMLCLPVLYFLVVKVPYRMKRILAFWQDSQRHK